MSHLSVSLTGVWTLSRRILLLCVGVLCDILGCVYGEFLNLFLSGLNLFQQITFTSAS